MKSVIFLGLFCLGNVAARFNSTDTEYDMEFDSRSAAAIFNTKDPENDVEADSNSSTEPNIHYTPKSMPAYPNHSDSAEYIPLITYMVLALTTFIIAVNATVNYNTIKRLKPVKKKGNVCSNLRCLSQATCLRTITETLQSEIYSLQEQVYRVEKKLLHLEQTKMTPKEIEGKYPVNDYSYTRDSGYLQPIVKAVSADYETLK